MSERIRDRRSRENHARMHADPHSTIRAACVTPGAGARGPQSPRQEGPALADPVREASLGAAIGLPIGRRSSPKRQPVAAQSRRKRRMRSTRPSIAR
jgi:hypothetical protein